MQRSKTTTDLGVLAQVAGEAIRTAPVDKRRSTKHSNSQPTLRPTATSANSHPKLVVDRRAMQLASRVRIVRAAVIGPSGARRPSVLRRTAVRSSHPQTRGRPTSYKSMNSRRSQRHHRSSPHSRTAREAKSNSLSHSGLWEKYI